MKWIQIPSCDVFSPREDNVKGLSLKTCPFGFVKQHSQCKISVDLVGYFQIERMHLQVVYLHFSFFADLLQYEMLNKKHKLNLQDAIICPLRSSEVFSQCFFVELDVTARPLKSTTIADPGYR